MSAKHQISLSVSDSINIKLKYYLKLHNALVTVQSLHTYNVIFKANNYMAHLAHRRQDTKFSGAWEAHHNYVADRSIKTIGYMVHTILIHMSMKNPKGVISTDLWPMSM